MFWQPFIAIGGLLLSVVWGVELPEECPDADSSVSLLQAKGNESREGVGLDDTHITFVKWFNSQRIGAQSHNVRLQRFDGMGVGVAAEKDISEGDEVLKVPLSRVFCRETLVPSLGLDSVGFNSSEISDANLIALALVLERSRISQRSEWHEYLRILPLEPLDVPFMFDEEELNATQSVYIVKRAKQRRMALFADHQSVIQPIMKVLAADKDMFDHAFVNNFTSFAWAISLIDSRALTIHGRKYLVPFADMFNFKPHDLVRQAEAGAFFLKHHILTKDTFTVLADRPTAQGNQVYEDYGDTPNHVYFEFHAFVPELNPFDCLEVRFDASRLEELSKDKLDLLRALKLPTSSSVCLNIAEIERAITQHPLFYLYRIVAFNTEEVAFCAETIKSEKDLMNGVRKCMQQVPRLVERLKEEALRHLGDVLSDLQNTTIEEDEALLSADILSNRMANIIKFRISQKKLLLDLTRFLSTGTLPPVAVYKDGLRFHGFANLLEGRKRGFNAEPMIALDGKLSRFNTWYSNHSGAALKVRAVASAAYRVGVLATSAVDEGEVYLGVPEALVMGSKTIMKSAVWPVMRDIEISLRKRDPFHSLLVFLMHEFFVEGVSSFWWPYLSLLPQPSELETPLYYSDEELSRLKEHPVFSKVIEIKKNVREVFKRVKSFILDRYGPDFFPSEVYTFENYLWAHTILDSRSIWWGGERHLVPMLDFVNCKAGTNTTRVHSTRENEKGEAITLADRSFRNGSEIFEDYGQPNHIYFLYHGFTLFPNHHDCLAFVLNGKENCMYEPIDFHKNAGILRDTSKVELASILQKQYADLLKRPKAAPSDTQGAAELFLNQEARLLRSLLAQLNPGLALESLFPTKD